MDQIINHAVLSLDFWQDTVTYEGSTMPTGTIGCEVLNIPDSTIEELDTPCNVLNQLLQGMNTGSVDMKLLPQVQQAAGEISRELGTTKEFLCWYFKNEIGRDFRPWREIGRASCRERV